MRFYYMVSHALVSGLRHFSFLMSSLIFTLIFTTGIALLGRAALVLSKAVLIEQQLADQRVYSEYENDTSGELIWMLSLYKYSCYLLLIAAVVIGLLYFCSFVTKYYMERKKDLAVQKYLGATGAAVAGEFTLEVGIPLLANGFLGILVARLIYSAFAYQASPLLRSYLLKPIYFTSSIDLPLLTVVAAMIVSIFFISRKKVRSI